ncbi:MAG: hypothetical protein KGJ06_03650 [Pseudomonadota bacterium]|nr:hypothetical protein [Pseudomonadota bacterium]
MLFLVTGHLALATLTACGFHPLYAQREGENTPAMDMLASVRIEAGGGPTLGRLSQEFKQDLEDRVNPGGSIAAAKAYRLEVLLNSTTSAIGVSRDGTVSRYNVYLSSQYKLYRLADNKLMTIGALNHVSSYNNIINAYFSTYVSEEDATRRGVQELAELYRQRLAAYFEEGAPIQENLPPDDKNKKTKP